MRTRLVCSAVASALAFAQAAYAETNAPASPPPVSVEERLERGVELRKQGRDAEALEEFREAYKADRSPMIRAQIAVAEQALGRWLDAERGLVLVLAVNDDPWIEARRKALEDALDHVRARLGWLVVESNVSGAELRVDGVRVAHLPLAEPIRVVAGTHTLEVTADGAVPVRRTVDVRGNGRIREAFELSTRTPAPGGSPSAAPVRLRPSSLSSGTVLIGSAFGALFATGAISLLIREINVARYNDASRCVVGDLSREDRCGAYRKAANTAEYVAIGAFTGAALAGIGAGFFLANDLLKSRHGGEAIRCAPRGWGLVCAAAF